ncbi:phosphate ABC transporter substrate-binding/OmpA family protein [Akkermansiaceae bacterium]|nr:phosphate ABC transporter substrate-binding/OmpA family protein [Akkermansiaceae bacterium]
MGVDLSEEEIEVLLRIHGSNTVGASLAPALVKTFLLEQGYSNIATQAEGVESTISFNQPGKKTLGDIEIKAHGSSTAFGETDSSKLVGLVGGFCDLGMSSRQIKPTERKFVNFTMSNAGQDVVDKTGLVGQGLTTNQDKKNADRYKSDLIADKNIPNGYKKFITRADRRNSQANIRFALGADELDINSANNLQRLADYLSQTGNESIKVLLIGFADNIGANSTNLALSKKRADSIANLLKAKGVRTIQTAAFGEAMPVADNKSESGRAKNPV